MSDVWAGALPEMPPGVRRSWRELARAASFHQTERFVECVAMAHGPDRVLAVWTGDALGCFTVADHRATSVLGDHAVVGRPSATVVETVATLASDACPQVRQVYFPLIAHLEPSSQADGGPQHWARRPSPTIAWGDGGATLLDRVQTRLGSRARRRWRRFDDAGGAFVVCCPQDAVAAVRTIEERSWKAAVGRSMLDLPAQWELYEALIRDGAVTVQVARVGGRPVAFRLDALHDEVVKCLKWSYDTGFARLSPGFALLTRGLVERWGGRRLDHVDLWGSPDTLKDALATGSYPRWDMAWPDDEHAHALRAEREKHDTESDAARERGASLRSTATGAESRRG